MKPLNLIPSVVVMSLAIMASAQTHSAAQKSTPDTDAQKSFVSIKALAGDWEGPVTLNPPIPEMPTDKPIHVSMRVTSRGNALVHEMQESGTPVDATKYDHPVTMLYLDGDRLTLVHYCDAGNRPRMVARPSADGKTVEFDFVDLSGGNERGHMYHAVFTTIDANHHLEDWTYMMPGDKPMHAHFDLQRSK
ncbi:MAG TPA: hypothetical protein VKB58_05695 [Terriglobales bacterium]|jgi:hypothetical protein|nr:hypothetical protein [Terriglobales bacterium]